jgi:Short C-terminal domain/PEGA domain
MRLLQALLSLSLLTVVSGCATIMHGTTQDIEIRTDPAGADILVDGRQQFKSPALVTMRRKDDHTVEISRQGYQKERVDIRGDMSLAVAGDFLAGGAIGYGIDAATGAQRRLVPEKVDVRLRPASGGGTEERMEVLEKIDQLNQRKEKGLITEEEYKKMRQDLIVSPH